MTYPLPLNNNKAKGKYQTGDYHEFYVKPEYVKIAPPQMSEEEFAELKASIQAEGQHYAIIVKRTWRF